MLRVFTVHDSKVDAFMPPFFVRSKGEAIRAFSDSVNDPQSNLCKHPGDFTLFELGEWDDLTAKFVLHPSPVSLGLAIEFVKQIPRPSLNKE